MPKVSNGDMVKVHYKGTLDDGTLFDSSEGRDPLEFTVGEGKVIKGFDEGVLGMELKEKKSLHIKAEHAYGHKDEKLIVDFPKEQLPQDLKPEEGMELQMQNNQGQVFSVIVQKITDTIVTLDANHPLAGQDLNFDIELVAIN